MIRKARLFILVIFCTAVCGCGSSVTDSEEMDSPKHMEGMDQLLEWGMLFPYIRKKNGENCGWLHGRNR